MPMKPIFQTGLDKSPTGNTRYGNLLPRLRELHRDIEPYAFTRDYFFETGARNTQALGLAANLHNWIKTVDENGEGFFASKLKEATAGLPDFYKEYGPK